MMYNYEMSRKEKPEKKSRKGTRVKRTRLILPGDDMPSEDDGDKDESGIFLEKEDVQLLYNTLAKYKPTDDEEVLYEIWLEEFEMMLAIDYKETPSEVR